MNTASAACIIANFADFEAIAPSILDVVSDAKNRKVVNLAILPGDFKGGPKQAIQPLDPKQMVQNALENQRFLQQAHLDKWNRTSAPSASPSASASPATTTAKYVAAAAPTNELSDMLEKAKQTTRITENLAKKVNSSPPTSSSSSSPPRPAAATPTAVGLSAAPAAMAPCPIVHQPALVQPMHSFTADIAHNFAASLQAAQEQAAQASRDARRLSDDILRSLTGGLSSGVKPPSSGNTTFSTAQEHEARRRDRMEAMKAKMEAKAGFRSAKAELHAQQNRIKVEQMHEAEQARKEAVEARKQAARAQKAAWQARFEGRGERDGLFAAANVGRSSGVDTGSGPASGGHAARTAKWQRMNEFDSFVNDSKPWSTPLPGFFSPPKPDMSARVDDEDEHLEDDPKLHTEAKGKSAAESLPRAPMATAIKEKGVQGYNVELKPEEDTKSMPKPRMATPEEEEMIAAYEKGMYDWEHKTSIPPRGRAAARPSTDWFRQPHNKGASRPPTSCSPFNYSKSAATATTGSSTGAGTSSASVSSAAIHKTTEAKLDALQASFDAFSLNFRKTLADTFGVSAGELPRYTATKQQSEETVLEGRGDRSVASASGVARIASAEAAIATPAATARQSVKAKHNATCDLCDQYIVGPRTKCLQCPDWWAARLSARLEKRLTLPCVLQGLLRNLLHKRRDGSPWTFVRRAAQ